MAELRFTSRIDASADDLFEWHARSGAFERLVPPWEDVRLVRNEGIGEGQRAELRVRKGPVSLSWVALHGRLTDGFTDTMESGPFRHWHHRHRFIDLGGRSELRDELSIRPTGTPLDPVAMLGLADTLRRQFVYRHRTTRGDLAAHARANPGGTSLSVGIVGANGLVGRQLAGYLSTGGHRVVRIQRRPDPLHDVRLWSGGPVPDGTLDGLDAVVHLAGMPVGPARWTAARREGIVRSRIDTTAALMEAVERSSISTVIVAGGTSVYGLARVDRVDEDSETRPGDGFLPDVCRRWEAAAVPQSGARTIVLRMGPVLWPSSGMLEPFRKAARAGIVPRIGDSSRSVHWIAMDDVLGAVEHVLLRSDMEGPVNLVAPAADTNASWCDAVREAAGRAVVVPIPASAIRTLYGQMADETILTDLEIAPRRLTESGFAFRFPSLTPALRHVLGRIPRSAHPDVDFGRE